MPMLNDVNRARLRRVFVGTDGIRGIWRILIFVGMLMAAGVVIHFGANALHIKPPQAPKTGTPLPPGPLVIAELLQVALVLGATAVMARIEHRRVAAYGYGSPRPVLHFLAGLAGGLACLSILVGLLTAQGYLVFDGVALHGPAILGYALVYLFGFFLVGVGEESIFRGYIQATLTRGMGFWPGALLMSVLFGAAHIHNHGETAFGIAGVVAAGLVFCLLLRVSGSLWLGIGFHTSWDWAQSYLYGTPDSGLMMQGHLLISHAVGNEQLSGGSAGPEGSLLAGPVMIGGLLALIWLCQRGGLFQDPVVHRVETGLKLAAT